MTDATTDTPQQPPTPNPDLRGLDRLVGTWNVQRNDRHPSLTIHVHAKFRFARPGPDSLREIGVRQ